MRKLLILLVVSVVACARPVFDPAGADLALTPEEAARPGIDATGSRVIWGGEIVEARNLADTTELVVLALPLERSQRPDPRGEPRGRFLVRYPGYLETARYEPGRHVTVPGTVVGVTTRPVGAASYRYPVVEAEAAHLWQRQSRGDVGVHFGIGIGIRG